MYTQDTDYVPPKRPLTWGQWVTRSIIAFVVVAILGYWRPIWIIPPVFRLTFILYVLLAWTGVIMLVVAAFRRPEGKRWIGVLGIVINVALSLALSVFIAALFLFGPSECSKPSGNQIVFQHTCRSSFFYRSYSMTFVTVIGSPLMVLIGADSSMSGFG